MITQALAAPGMAAIDSLVADERRLGYAYATSAGTTTHVLCAEAACLNSTVVFYTDGITDAPRGQQLEHDVLHRLLAGLHGQPADTIRTAIRSELSARRPHGNTDDTAVLIRQVTPNTATMTPTDEHRADVPIPSRPSTGPVTTSTVASVTPG